MMLSTMLLAVIALYYLRYGREFLSLRRLSEPAFIVNVSYVLSFPLRAVMVLLFPDAVESAPNFVLDIAILNRSLGYSFLCILVFNVSYRFFLRGRASRDGGAPAAQARQAGVPKLLFAVYLLFAVVYTYYLVTSEQSYTLNIDPGSQDIPQLVHLVGFSLPFMVAASFLTYVVTRKPVHLLLLAVFLGSSLYVSFIVTTKYSPIAYVLLFGIILAWLGYRPRLRHLVMAMLVIVPVVMLSYMTRYASPETIAPDASLTARGSSVSGLLTEFRPDQLFTKFFVLKVTDRFVYLEALMIYIRVSSTYLAADLYDKLGSLPTILVAVPSIFGVDKSWIQDPHHWFANKYWYGFPTDAAAGIVPFGRITESYMLFGYGGFLMFVGYAWLFAFLYRRCYLSGSAMLLLYYCLICYYYVFPDSSLMGNVSVVVQGSVLYFGLLLTHELWLRRYKDRAEGHGH